MPTRDNLLFPDQFVNIHLVMESRAHALVVPSAAIQSGVQGSYVWATDTDAQGAGTVKMQPVKVALTQGQVTILDGGVERGDQVVVDGADRLRPGSADHCQRCAAVRAAAPASADLGVPKAAAHATARRRRTR